MQLTERQQEVAERLGQGESVKAIAGSLRISDKTVYRHVEDIAGRLPGSGPPLRRVMRWILSTKAA